MTRKDTEKDSDRTHYYSQFWLDVAAGRRIIGAPKEDEAEAEPLEPALSVHRGSRGVSYDDSSDEFDGPDERIVHPVAEPLATPEEFIASEPEEIELEVSTPDAPDSQEELVGDMDIPDMDLGPADEEKDDDEELAEDEDAEEDVDAEGDEDAEPTDGTEEEEDEDLGWGGRGRKRNKPVRPKVVPKKAPRREPRRGY